MSSTRWLSRFISPSPQPFEHFTISRGATRRGFETLPCLLARAWPDGDLVLLNPSWDVLGYSDEELIGRSFCELIALERHAACAAFRALLAFDNTVQFNLRCKDRREMRCHWNRQFDGFTNSMFIIGDPLPAALETPAHVGVAP
ncbi:MAG TPA: PAS domain-containing protein [Steroidobacteraceae bacterium]|nr:PAS domain-containing protein [Steroidobacteraceae bacterium]